MSGTTTLTWPRRATFVDRDNQGTRNQPNRYTKGDTVDVDDDNVDAWTSRGWEVGTPDEVLDDGDSDAAQDAQSAAQQVDPDVFVQAFVAQDAQDQADAIEAGEVDGYLDAIEAANADGEDYTTVAEAIEARRDEVQG